MTIGPANTGNQGERGQLLASTVDRDRAVDYLKTAFAEGRLSPEEYDVRAGRALTARTYADLDAVTTDLPGARPAAPPAPPGTNALAITAMICGIVQFFGFWLLATIPAVVCGHIARRQIKRTGEQGAGMATAGIVLGWIGVGLSVLAAVLIAIIAAAAIHAAHTTPPPAGG